MTAPPTKPKPVTVPDFLSARSRGAKLAGSWPEVATRAKMISITGRRNVLQRFREACLLAQREVFVVTTAELAANDAPLGRLLDQAIGRGISVHVLPEPAR